MDSRKKKCIPQIPAEIVSGLSIFAAEEVLWKMTTDCSTETDDSSTDAGARDTQESSKSSRNSAKLASAGKAGVMPGSLQKSMKPTNPSESDGKVFSYFKVKFDREYLVNVYGKDIAHICAFFNKMLAHSSLASECLPLNDFNLIYKLSDGVLLCAMANALQPGTVDEAAVFRGPVLKYPCGWIHKWKNVNLGLMSLQNLGLYIGTNYVRKNPGRTQGLTPLPPAILLQVMRLSALRKMNLKDNEQLVYTFDSWQDEHEITGIKTQSGEEMLRRWVNYQLRRAGTDLELKDFTTGLADSLIYGHLLGTVAPQDKKASLTSVKQLKAEKDLTLRAARVIKNAQILGINCSIAPEHIAGASTVMKPSASVSNLIIYVMNLAFLSQIYSSYPSIDAPKQSLNPKFSESLRSSYIRGSTEEMLVMWLNSFGVSSPVVYLDTDLRNGLTLLQAWEAMYPGCVDWSQVNFNVPDTRTPRYKVCCLGNCSQVIRCAKDYGIQVTCSAEDIATGESKNTRTLLLSMMNLGVVIISRSRVIDSGPRQTIWQRLDLWLGEFLKLWRSNVVIESLADPRLKSTNALGFIGERQLFKSQCSVFSKRCGVSGANGAGPAESDGKSPPDAGTRRNAAPEAEESKRKRQDGAPEDKRLVFQFKSIQPVSTNELERHSRTVITELQQCGVSVFTSKLGPSTDGLIYNSALLQIWGQ